MIIEFTELEKLRRDNKDKKIVFSIGVFDLTHVGHILFFDDCKRQGDILVVGVGRDSFIKSYKGSKRPILNEHIRLKTVDSLKPIDYAFLDECVSWEGKQTHEKNLGKIFRALKPDVYIVNDDGIDLEKRKGIAENYGIKMIILPRHCPEEFDNISTSRIIKRIKNL